MSVTLADIEAAAQRLDGVAVRTPLLESPALNDAAGHRVLLKPECLQRTGSFKIRGAYNLLRRLPRDVAKRGVVAWSSGNHAQGVACAAKLLGVQAAIVMPSDAPAVKRDATQRMGGEVIAYDRYSGDREVIARALAAERGAALVPSYEHPDIIAGQGTVGLEIADELAARGLVPGRVVIPCGGGGLSSGTGLALRTRFPGCAPLLVEPAAFDDTVRSLASGRRESIDPASRSICDALQTPSPGEMTLAINRSLGADAVAVSDAEVRAAMRFAFRELKLVVEPGGAAALAATLAGRVTAGDGVSVVVLSGGNVDAALFAEIQAEPN